MKGDLDHLPARQQHELARVRDHLLQEFDAAIKSGGGGTQSWRRDGRILKIVLFGSYAPDDWVDEPASGYLSDFDILVIVSHENLTKVADYWYVAEDKILNDQRIGRTVNLIVHDLAEVNQALGRGEYFWTDIVRDGIALYEVPGHPLGLSRPVTVADARSTAERYFSAKFGDIDVWLREAVQHITQNGETQRGRKHAAFRLHQAVETAYACFLLVHTFYFPRSHNIKFLRSLAEDADKSLIAAWPRSERQDRRRFELLKRAYVEARYSDQYDISTEDLEALADCVRALRDLVEASCRKRIEDLRLQAEA